MNQREADWREKNEDGKKKEEKDSLTGILSDKMLLLRMKWNMMFQVKMTQTNNALLCSIRKLLL